MRVAIVNHYAKPPSVAGGSRHFMLAKELIARGHEAVILASTFDHATRRQKFQTNPQSSPDEGVPFVWMRTPSYKGNGLDRVWNMLVFGAQVGTRGREAISSCLSGVDVVVGSSPHLFAAEGARHLATQMAVPFVLEVRDLWPQTWVDLGEMSKWHPAITVARVMERHLCRSSVRIVSLVPFAADYLVPIGVPPERITWIPNGVDVSRLTAPNPPTHRDAFRIGYAGSHGRANSLDTLLDAAGLLLRKHFDAVEFTLIGEGPEKARLMRRATEEGLKNVSFRSAVPRADIPSLLAGFDALVVTMQNSPLYRYGISFNKLSDYMAAARPIIFASSSANDPIAESEAGLSVPAEDAAALAQAVVDLKAQSAEARYAMGLRGRRYVEAHLDIRILARRLEVVLEAAIAGFSDSRSLAA